MGALEPLVVTEIDPGDSAAVSRALEFTARKPLNRALLAATLELSPLRERSRHWEAVQDSRVIGLMCQIDGVYSGRQAAIASMLPGPATALIEKLERPARCLAPQMLWPEIERAGGTLSREQMQMVRFIRRDLPPRDPRVKRLDDERELLAFLQERFSPLQLRMGPFFGIRDGDGALAAAGGVEFVTARVAQIAYVKTREDFRRKGLARAVVTELLRTLETEDRCVALQVRSDNVAAIQLYGEMGFRGSRRLAEFVLDGDGTRE